MKLSDALKTRKLPPRRRSDVLEVVSAYCEAKGIAKALLVSQGLKKKYPMGRMCARAKRLLEECGGHLGDALWAVQFGGYFL